MPQIELLEGHRALMRQVRKAQPVRAISRSLRPFLRTLYSADFVSLAFDWEVFDTVVVLTEAGSNRLEHERARAQTRL